MDHNATAPVADESRQAVLAALDEIGNPSSIHREGRAARDLVEEARRRVAALVGGDADEVVFTSGGTEADALGVVGLAMAAQRAGCPPRVVTTPIEHPAVSGAARGLVGLGFEVVEVRVDRDGRLDLDDLSRRCAGGGAVLAFAAVNHELGTWQDVAAAAAIARAAGLSVHVDAVQAAGRAPLAPIRAVADTVAISGHKLGAPKGTGALWIRRGVDVASPWPGGHQERGRRPGTENVPGIAGLGAVAATADLDRWAAVAALAARLEAGLVRLGARIHGDGAPRIGNTINAAFAGARGESIVIALDLAGVSASTGAACTSGSVRPSSVLLGLGYPAETAREAIRFSLGTTNTDDDVARVLAVLPPIVERARR
jgi:cysteine desulfurase